ncbi:MAG TPA: NUDIX domain-containing protein, partial [Thermoanaerobaculia bacterium]|nr:NUDIX domain-containing protein [Thermoanaerobaculia bacterium]
AVAAIAFGAATLPIEANIRRVASRLFATPDPAPRLPEVLSRERIGDSIAALFDLGQTVCRPRNPACPRCPVATECRARAQDRVADFPSRPARGALRPWYRCAAAVFRGGRLLLRRRPAGWLAGMWELPGVESASLAAARAHFRRRFPGAAPTPEPVVVQPIAGRRVHVEVYRSRRAPALPGDRWMTVAEIESGAAPSLTKKIVRGLSERSA